MPERKLNPILRAVCLTTGLLAGGLFDAAPARAHGWHNAALTTSSLDEWLGDVKRAIPDILQRATETELHAGRGLDDLKKKRSSTPRTQPGMLGPQRGRQIISQLTPQQQELLGRKAEDAMEALAFMDPANIFPEEFPRFDLSKIPEYRETAVKLLKLMGPVGTRAVISELRAELMGMGRSTKARDYRVNPAYYNTLVQLLFEGVSVGEADPEDVKDLQLATKGFKPPPYDALAKLIGETLAAAEATRDTLPKLADRIAAPGTEQIKQTLLKVLEQRLPDATVEEITALLEHDDGLVRQKATGELAKRADKLGIAELIAIEQGLEDENAQTARAFSEIYRRRIPQAKSEELLALAKLKDPSLKQMARRYLAKNIRGQDVASLLDMQQMFAGDPLARSVSVELAGRSPKYAEVKDQLEKIVGFLRSSDTETARAAERQTANAFQRAPMRECLRWLSVDDDRLRKVIWKQVDGRLARADAARKDGYRQVALEELASDGQEIGVRLAAIELIERLGDLAAVQPLLDLLPRLPRELWPRSGEALRKLTRQDFGPRHGDGVAELTAALAKWRGWLAKQK